MLDNLHFAQFPSTDRWGQPQARDVSAKAPGRPSRIRRAALVTDVFGGRYRWCQPVPGLENTPGTRLARLRLHSGHATAADAARAMGANLTTYQQHELGTRNVSGQAAVRYGTFFGVAPSLILYGEATPPPAPRRVPVVGVVGLHGRIWPRMDHAPPRKSPEGDFAEVPEFVAAPPGAEDGLQSLVVIEDDLAPAYRAGDVVFYDGAGLAQPECTRLPSGRECVVETADGARLLCLAEPDGAGTWTLRSYRGRPMRQVRLRSLAPVLWVQRAAVPAISH